MENIFKYIIEGLILVSFIAMTIKFITMTNTIFKDPDAEKKA